MAHEIPVFTFPLEAGADLSAHQFRPVKLNATGKVVRATGVADKVIGILQNKPKNGGTANVMNLGITKVFTEGAVAIDDYVSPGADGVATTGTTSGSVYTIIGIMLSAGADNTIATCLLKLDSHQAA